MAGDGVLRRGVSHRPGQVDQRPAAEGRLDRLHLSVRPSSNLLFRFTLKNLFCIFDSLCQPRPFFRSFSSFRTEILAASWFRTRIVRVVGEDADH